MVIGVLLGEQYSFLYDLELIFWVLFCICIHYNGPAEKPESLQDLVNGIL